MAVSDLMDLQAYVAEKLAGALSGSDIAYDELTLTTDVEHIVSVLRFLRDDVQTRFVCFVDLAGVDYPERSQRFEVVYHLLSPSQNLRVRIKLSTDANTPVPSVMDVFPAADWFEREAYDLYGILFTGHPDLRRLLTDYGFEGHPLRKDFPLTGFTEVRYDDEQKRVIYEPVTLRQEFRSFDFLSPWEGTDYVLPNELKGDEKVEKTN
ncbi:MAG: NADH-quinone oxidoreductase subunit C [Pseudomonadota bacterium]